MSRPSILPKPQAYSINKKLTPQLSKIEPITAKEAKQNTCNAINQNIEYELAIIFKKIRTQSSLGYFDLIVDKQITPINKQKLKEMGYRVYEVSSNCCTDGIHEEISTMISWEA